MTAREYAIDTKEFSDWRLFALFAGETASSFSRGSLAVFVTMNVMMQERDIFDERQETKKASYSCPFCRERNDYDVRWLKRVKKKNVPRQMNEHDRARFDKSRDYMVRVDDQLMCLNIRCRKRFEIPSSQTVVFI